MLRLPQRHGRDGIALGGQNAGKMLASPTLGWTRERMRDPTTAIKAEASRSAGAPALRAGLLYKYVGLFFAVVLLALLTNGAFEVWYNCHPP